MSKLDDAIIQRKAEQNALSEKFKDYAKSLNYEKGLNKGDNGYIDPSKINYDALMELAANPTAGSNIITPAQITQAMLMAVEQIVPDNKIIIPESTKYFYPFSSGMNVKLKTFDLNYGYGVFVNQVDYFTEVNSLNFKTVNPGLGITNQYQCFYPIFKNNNIPNTNQPEFGFTIPMNVPMDYLRLISTSPVEANKILENYKNAAPNTVLMFKNNMINNFLFTQALPKLTITNATPTTTMECLLDFFIHLLKFQEVSPNYCRGSSTQGGALTASNNLEPLTVLPNSITTPPYRAADLKKLKIFVGPEFYSILTTGLPTVTYKNKLFDFNDILSIDQFYLIPGNITFRTNFISNNNVISQGLPAVDTMSFTEQPLNNLNIIVQEFDSDLDDLIYIKHYDELSVENQTTSWKASMINSAQLQTSFGVGILPWGKGCIFNYPNLLNQPGLSVPTTTTPLEA